MATDLQIVIDCTDPDAVSMFWLSALRGYDYPGSDPNRPPGSPPPGFRTWEAWADAQGIPEDQRYDQRTIIDTVRERPDIHFVAVPEKKTVKNRLHLDLHVTAGASPDEARAVQDAEVERLIALGATLVERREYAVMRDVEGKEFCVT